MSTLTIAPRVARSTSASKPKRPVNPPVFTEEGWHFFMPEGEVRLANGFWLYVENTTKGFLAKLMGDYVTAESIGAGTWSGPFDHISRLPDRSVG